MLPAPAISTLLGWDEIRGHLAAEAVTPHGRARCQALEPATRTGEIHARQQRCRQLQHLLDEGILPPLEPVEEVEADLVRAGKQGVLVPEAVRRVGQAMRISSRLRGFLLEEGHRAGGALTELARGSHDLSGPGRDLLAAFDDGDTLRDSASPALGPLRRTARDLAARIRRRLEEILRNPRRAVCLREPYVTQRGDRYVLPVRADAPSSFPGIVHDTSQSGATLFVEPAELVEEGNRLKIAHAAVVEEERRILAEYSAEIAGLADALRDNLAMLAGFDLVHAAQRLGDRLQGRLIEVGGDELRLLAARHPLMRLGGEQVVANDIRLGPGRRCLVVTGPNAGGKTVTLTTTALVVLMAQAGLPVPAGEGSCIPAFSRLRAVIGDAQDIHRGLSTFSAHVAHIAAILQEADGATLVLLDEVAADTEPRHGAALACALLEHLVARGSTVVVTTHFDQLKQLAYRDERFANASVGFDTERMQPTYTLHPDVPGRSLTFDIARRLALPDEVLQAAAARLDPSGWKTEQMLESLDRERHALQELRGELATRTREATEAAAVHRREAEELSATRARILAGQREALIAEIQEARREAATLLERLRTDPAMPSAVAAGRRLKSMEDELRTGPRTGNQPAPAPPVPAGADEPPLQPGDRVVVTHLDKEGEVVSVDPRAGMVSVRLGSTMRTRVAVEQIRRLGPAPRPHQAPPSPAPVEETGGEDAPRTVDNQVDLRGLRVEEALEATERFLDRLFGAGRTTAYIVHGHGTGALKSAVRDYLRTSPYPVHFRAGAPGEGGDGITVVKMK